MARGDRSRVAAYASVAPAMTIGCCLPCLILACTMAIIRDDDYGNEYGRCSACVRGRALLGHTQSIATLLGRSGEEPGMAIEVERGIGATVGFVVRGLDNFGAGCLRAGMVRIDIVQVNEHAHRRCVRLARAEHAPLLGALSHHNAPVRVAGIIMFPLFGVIKQYRAERCVIECPRILRHITHAVLWSDELCFGAAAVSQSGDVRAAQTMRHRVEKIDRLISR
jgi:hypothetical protein